MSMFDCGAFGNITHFWNSEREARLPQVNRVATSIALTRAQIKLLSGNVMMLRSDEIATLLLRVKVTVFTNMTENRLFSVR